jgi:hypothetical protein
MSSRGLWKLFRGKWRTYRVHADQPRNIEQGPGERARVQRTLYNGNHREDEFWFQVICPGLPRITVLKRVGRGLRVKLSLLKLLSDATCAFATRLLPAAGSPKNSRFGSPIRADDHQFLDFRFKAQN